MAVLYITEYAMPVVANGQGVQCGQEPALAIQQLAIGGASVLSAAFHAQTRFVRLHTDAICAVLFSNAAGADPTAAAGTSQRMAAGSTEYFGVNPGHKVAVITTT